MPAGATPGASPPRPGPCPRLQHGPSTATAAPTEVPGGRGCLGPWGVLPTWSLDPGLQSLLPRAQRPSPYGLGAGPPAGSGAHSLPHQPDGGRTHGCRLRLLSLESRTCDKKEEQIPFQGSSSSLRVLLSKFSSSRAPEGPVPSWESSVWTTHGTRTAGRSPDISTDRPHRGRALELRVLNSAPSGQQHVSSGVMCMQSP